MNFYYQKPPLFTRAQDFFESRAFLVSLLGLLVLMLIMVIGVVKFQKAAPTELNPLTPTYLISSVSADTLGKLQVNEFYVWDNWQKGLPGAIRAPRQTRYYSELQPLPAFIQRSSEAARLLYTADPSLLISPSWLKTFGNEPLDVRIIPAAESEDRGPLVVVGNPAIGFPAGPVAVQVSFETASVATHIRRERMVRWRVGRLGLLCPTSLYVLVNPPPGTAPLTRVDRQPGQARAFGENGQEIPLPAGTKVVGMLIQQAVAGEDGFVVPAIVIDNVCSRKISAVDLSVSWYEQDEAAH